MSGTDLREKLLARLQACIRTLAPGVVYSFPMGLTHRPIVSDLGGGTDPSLARVFSRMRSVQKFDMTDLPAVEIITAMNQPDVVTFHDDNLFRREIAVQIWAYVAAQDGGDGLDAVVRPDMNELVADLQVAVEAFPYWTNGADVTDPLWATHGPITITTKAQYTEPAAEQAIGILVLDYSIAYCFPRLNP
jgi:hypothetical protein